MQSLHVIRIIPMIAQLVQPSQALECRWRSIKDENLGSVSCWWRTKVTKDLPKINWWIHHLEYPGISSIYKILQVLRFEVFNATQKLMQTGQSANQCKQWDVHGFSTSLYKYRISIRWICLEFVSGCRLWIVWIVMAHDPECFEKNRL